MLEYLPVPLVIAGCLLYAWWRKAYLTQVIVVANFLIFAYVFALDYSNSAWFPGIMDSYTFVPAWLGEPAHMPSIITSMFMHAEPYHLIGNILVLYLIGLPLEERIGSKNWGIIYFTTGIAATLLFWVFHPSSLSHLLGASGAIYGLGGAFLILYPKDRIAMFLGPFFTTRAPVWAAVGIMFAMETFLVMMAVDDGTAHIAHVGGIVCGIFLAPLIVKKSAEKKKHEDIDYEMLRRMVVKKEDNQIIDKIEAETEPEVKKAWLDFFLKEGARCPKCRRRLGEGYDKSKKSPADEPKITCACGESYTVWK